MMSLAGISGDPLAFAMAATFHSKVASGLSKVNLIDFQNAITEHLESPTTRACLSEDMRNLTDMVMSIETCFEDIRYRITRIESKRLLSDQGGQPIDFTPKWKVLHDEYTSLMTESQLTANKVSSKIDDLLQVILPVIESDSPLDDKKSSLDEYIKSLDVFQAEGQRNAARFLRLRHNVATFRKDIKETVVDQQVDVGNKIRKLDKKIAKLQADLDSSAKIFASCVDVLKFSAPDLLGAVAATLSSLNVTGTMAGVSGLAAFAPAVGIGILVIAFISFGFSITKGIKERAEQRQVKIDELASLQDEHEAAMFKSHQLKEVLEQMRTLDVDFDHMLSRLGSIHGIWNMLVTDAQRLKNLLSSLKATNNAQVFKATARGVTVTYEMLQLALDQYSLAVAK